jgi:hypothetical protein
LHHAIFRFEITAKADRECAYLSILREQSLPSSVRLTVAREFAAAARRLRHESLGLFQDNSAFLFELFLAGLDHLIVLRFLEALFDELLANALFIVDPVRAVTGGRRYDVPLFDDASVLLRFLRRVGSLRPEQFSASLVPIGIREFVRVAFGDEGNFTRSFFDRIG